MWSMIKPSVWCYIYCTVIQIMMHHHPPLSCHAISGQAVLSVKGRSVWYLDLMMYKSIFNNILNTQQQSHARISPYHSKVNDDSYSRIHKYRHLRWNKARSLGTSNKYQQNTAAPRGTWMTRQSHWIPNSLFLEMALSQPVNVKEVLE